MTKIIEHAKKYDRSIVAVASTIATLFAGYLTMGNRINEMISRSPCVVELKQSQAVQNEINRAILEGMKELRSDMKTVLREMPR